MGRRSSSRGEAAAADAVVHDDGVSRHAPRSPKCSRFRIAFLVAAVLAAPGVSSAQGLWCQPPSKPYCAEGFGAFVNEFDVQQCRAEVEEYRRRMRAYLECLREESEVALRDINRVIDAFNRRAREAG
mgnify:CR=1 FL=1